LINTKIKLEKVNRELALLNNINDIILRVHDENSLLDLVCESIVEHGQYKLAWICFQPDENDTLKKVVPLASSGSIEYLNSINISLSDGELSKGPTASVLLKGITVITNDVNRSESFQPWLEKAKKFNIASSIVLPLNFKLNDEINGAINIYSDRIDAFDEHEADVLKRIAENISLAIQNIRTKHQNENSQKELEKRVNELAIIYQLSQLLKDENTDITSLFYEIIELFSFSNYHNKIIGIQIDYDNQYFETPQFQKSNKNLVFVLSSKFKKKGHIEIYCLKEHENNEKLQTEIKSLIFTIVNGIEEFLNKKFDREALALSEANFRGAFEYSAIGMCLVSLDGKWIKVNKEMCQIIGYDEDELLQRESKDITHIDFHKSDLQFVNQLLTGEKEYYRTEKKYIHKSGREIWVEINVALIKDEFGKPLYFVDQVEDITNDKLMANQLKENVEILKLFVENSPATLAMFDVNMNYIQVSNRWYEDFNIIDKSIIGKNLYEVIPTITEEWKTFYKRCLAGETLSKNDDYFTRNDGTKEWINWEIHPWHKADGSIGGIIKFAQIITKIKESELKFKNLVEDTIVSVYILQDSKLVYVNPNLCNESGYSEDELLGAYFAQFIHHEDLNKVEQQIKERINGTNSSGRYEIRIKKKNGDYDWFEILGAVTVYNRAPAIIGTLINITEKRKIFDELSVSEANLKSIFNNSNIGYMLVDINFKIITINTFLKNQFLSDNGINIVEGISIIDQLPENRKNRTIELFKKCIDTKETIHTTSSYSNIPKYYSTSLIPVLNHDEVISFCLTSIDITKEKLIELEREKIIAELIQKNNDLEQFAHIVSHNIRGPLASILGLNNLLKDPNSIDHRDYIIDGINTSSEKLDSVLKDLNEILKLKREISENKKKIILTKLIKEVKGGILQLIITTGASIEFNFEKADTIYTIKSYILNIFHNILVNAIKFTPNNRYPCIKIWSEINDEKILIHFKDNGMGIDMKMNGEKVFKLYSRFHNKIEGKGIGLFMTKTQVEAIGGKITLSSEFNIGTHVTISLPI